MYALFLVFVSVAASPGLHNREVDEYAFCYLGFGMHQATHCPPLTVTAPKGTVAGSSTCQAAIAGSTDGVENFIQFSSVKRCDLDAPCKWSLTDSYICCCEGIGCNLEMAEDMFVEFCKGPPPKQIGSHCHYGASYYPVADCPPQKQVAPDFTVATDGACLATVKRDVVDGNDNLILYRLADDCDLHYPCHWHDGAYICCCRGPACDLAMAHEMFVEFCKGPPHQSGAYCHLGAKAYPVADCPPERHIPPSDTVATFSPCQATIKGEGSNNIIHFDTVDECDILNSCHWEDDAFACCCKGPGCSFYIAHDMFVQFCKGPPAQ